MNSFFDVGLLQAADTPRLSLAQAFRSARRELLVTYRIIWRDLSASMIPASLFALGALHTTSEWTGASIGSLALRCSLYFFFYIYTFCLCNQITGYEEDCINKPDRVLPSKMITMSGAKLRWVTAMVAFPVVGYALGGASMMGWALLWEATTVAYNHWGLDRHWFSKNVIFISVGSIALLAAAWELAAPLTPTAWKWILFVSVAFGVTLNLQDLRDLEGDRASGRRTLPIVMGDGFARWVIAGAIAALPIATHAILIGEKTLTVPVIAVEAALATANLSVALRTVRRRSPRADHKTYMVHTYWFCGVLASALVILGPGAPV